MKSPEMRHWDEVVEVKFPEMWHWDEAEEVKLPRWGFGMGLGR